MWGHLCTSGYSATVKSDTGAAWRAVSGDHSSIGPKTSGRVLGGDSALQRKPVWLDALLVQAKIGKGRSGCNFELGLNQVDVGDLLGHGVLNLDSRIHLDKYVLTSVWTNGVNQELDGASILVTNFSGKGDGVAEELLAELLVQKRSWSNLHDFLVTSLDRAVSLVKVNHISIAVGKDLYLDVTRSKNRLLQKDSGVTKSTTSLAHSGLEGSWKISCSLNLAHASAATASYGFHKQRKSNGFGLGNKLRGIS